MRIIQGGSSLLAVLAASALAAGMAAAADGQTGPTPDIETLQVGMAGQLSNLINAALAQAKQQQPPSNHDAVTSRRRRALGTSKLDCDTYMTLSLAPLTTECSLLSAELNSMTTLDTATCERKYDMNQGKMDTICTNACYTALVDALGKMSAAGCPMESVTQSMCSQCPGGTACVNGACLPACSAKKPCPCGDQCVEGGCQPTTQVGFQRADLGVYGYKVSLEQMCLVPPAAELPEGGLVGGYCATAMGAALGGGISMETCDKVAGAGCCAGTFFQFARQCALANDTITTAFGPIKMADIENICTTVDFKKSCSNAPTFTADSCKRGWEDPQYVELPFPSLDSFKHGSFSMIGIYAFIGGIAAMVGVLFAVRAYQTWGHQKNLAQAKQAAEAVGGPAPPKDGHTHSPQCTCT